MVNNSLRASGNTTCGSALFFSYFTLSDINVI